MMESSSRLFAARELGDMGWVMKRVREEFNSRQ